MRSLVFVLRKKKRLAPKQTHAAPASAPASTAATTSSFELRCGVRPIQNRLSKFFNLSALFSRNTATFLDRDFGRVSLGRRLSLYSPSIVFDNNPDLFHFTLAGGLVKRWLTLLFFLWRLGQRDGDWGLFLHSLWDALFVFIRQQKWNERPKFLLMLHDRCKVLLILFSSWVKFRPFKNFERNTRLILLDIDCLEKSVIV